MDKELYIFLGAMGAALISYIAAIVTGRNQLKIADMNLTQHLKLQESKLEDTRLKEEVSLERQKLEKLHITLSRISFENSQTMSFIQSDTDSDLNKFRARYIENCERLHEAQAIVDLYYPEMSEKTRKISGYANVFWGYQEQLIQTDIKTNLSGWQSALEKITTAGQDIYSTVKDLQSNISKRGELLKNGYHKTI